MVIVVRRNYVRPTPSLDPRRSQIFPDRTNDFFLRLPVFLNGGLIEFLKFAEDGRGIQVGDGVVDFFDGVDLCRGFNGIWVCGRQSNDDALVDACVLRKFFQLLLLLFVCEIHPKTGKHVGHAT